MKRLYPVCSAVFLALSACGGGSETAEPPASPADLSPPEAPKAEDHTPRPEAPKPTMAELQQKYVENELSYFNARDAQKYSRLYTEDAVSVMPGATGLEETRGRDAIAKSFAELFAAFPDMTSTNLRVLTKDNVVAVQWICTGTHRGDFMGMKASNKPIGINGLSIVWLNDEGLVSRAHTYLDQATIASQVGASDAPARGIPELPSGKPEWVSATNSEMEKKNEETVKEFVGTFAKKDVKAFLAFHSDDAVYSDFSQPKDVVGHKEAKAMFNQFATAFPDIALNTSGVWGIGDYVVFECNFTGTHTGKLGPIKATKKAVSLHGADVALLKDGKFEHGWGYTSNLEMMGQLGLLPPPPTTKQ